MDASLTLTIYDIVSHLIPGSAVLLFFYFVKGYGKDLQTSLLLPALAIVGYLLGAVLNILGLLVFRGFYPDDYKDHPKLFKLVNWLERFICRLPFLKVKSVSKEVKTELTKIIKKKIGVDFTENRLGIFAVSDTYVASLPFLERDTLLSKEAFFRSLATLSIIATIYFLFSNDVSNKLLVLIAGTVCTEVFRYGREYFRTIKNQQIYTLALIKLKEKK